MQKIILASQSPRRKQLLEWANIPFDIIVHETDERYPAELPIATVPEFIARQKALTVKQNLVLPDQLLMPVVAADTVVILNNTIIGKPANKQDAVEILQALSGNHHQVITGVVIFNGDQEISFSETTDVLFHPLTNAQIEYYVDNYKPFDKAGAYAIQEWIGVVGIKHISGDFYNVMGLPVSRVVQALQALQQH